RRCGYTTRHRRRWGAGRSDEPATPNSRDARRRSIAAGHFFWNPAADLLGHETETHRESGLNRLQFTNDTANFVHCAFRLALQRGPLRAIYLQFELLDVRFCQRAFAGL